MNHKVKKYKDFYLKSNKLNENFPDFGGSGNSATLTGQPVGGGAEPKDPNLSLDGWDKHKENLRGQFRRLQDILTNVFASGGRRTASVSDIFDDLTDLSIVRIFKNNQDSLDIYLKFKYLDEDYYASFKNWASNNTKETFQSKLFSENPSLTSKFENIIKVQGVFKKALQWWFIPEDREYKALQDVKVYDDMGNIEYISSGSRVDIIETITENDKPYIHLVFENKSYKIMNHDYYYFNWWFEQTEQTKYYL